MRLLFLDILEHGFAHRPQWISRIQDMQNNIRRIDDFVQFTVDSARSALLVNGFVVIGVGGCRIDDHWLAGT